jgi:hypothetical protein
MTTSHPFAAAPVETERSEVSVSNEFSSNPRSSPSHNASRDRLELKRSVSAAVIRVMLAVVVRLSQKLSF